MTHPLLQPGRNVCRIEPAGRAVVLIDGAAFFDAVRRAFLNARHSIYVLGWDIDSRTRLVGPDNSADDGYAMTLAELLTELAVERPDLHVHLLLWDYSVLYAGERELFPRLALQWGTPERIALCLDDTVPFGCSQHQKIIVVDDALAFSGGLDLTIRRWDTSAHAVPNADRVDPDGKPYRPFHDVQMMVDGQAARALAEIAHERWCRANQCDPNDIRPVGDPWPVEIVPHFTDLEIGISRTVPECEGQRELREVETLFLDMIDSAQRTIYIENQFVTATSVANRLAKRLRDNPKLEVVIVAPRSHDSWVEARTMRNGRIRFWRTLKEAGGDRVRLVYPAVEGDESGTMVHSKIMVVDDRVLRVGSANLNQRSMGADTECDLIVEARDEAERAAIVHLRDTLLGEHCGADAATVARVLAAHGGSLLAVVDGLAQNGHSLKAIDDGEPDDSEMAAAIEEVADPRRPLQVSRLWRRLTARLGIKADGAVVMILAALALVVALTLAWSLTPLSQIADPERVTGWLRSAGGIWSPLLVLAIYLIGGLIAFPVVILIVATAAAFGPWLGFAYAVAGVMASALLNFAIGARFGQEALDRFLGKRMRKLRDAFKRRGVLAIATLRMVPVAPFAIINLVAGASGIGLFDYLAGTLLGMLPGLIVSAILGGQIMSVFTDPSAGQVALLMLAVAAWIGMAFGVQALVSRRESKTS